MNNFGCRRNKSNRSKSRRSKKGGGIFNTIVKKLGIRSKKKPHNVINTKGRTMNNNNMNNWLKSIPKTNTYPYTRPRFQTKRPPTKSKKVGNGSNRLVSNRR